MMKIAVFVVYLFTIIIEINAQLRSNLFGDEPQAAQSFCGSGSNSGSSFVGKELTDNCRRSKMDLMLLVDGSSTAGLRNFNKIKEFLKQIVDATEIGRDRSRIGLIQFSTNPRTEFSLNQYFNSREIKDAIDRMHYLRGGRNAGRALQHALNRELISSRGDRPEVKTVVILVTDGRSRDDPKQPAQQMRSRGDISIITIGIEKYRATSFTSQLHSEQLLDMAGSRDRVFKVCRFERLDRNVRNAVAAQICSDNDRCRNAKSDMILLVDGSASIEAQNFQRLKEFLKLIVDSIDVGLSQTRIGLVQFNHEAHTEMRLDQSLSADAVRRSIDQMPWRKGRTKVGNALSYLLTQEYQAGHGDRENFKNVVVVLTDGRSEDSPGISASQLRWRGAKLLAVGITDRIDLQQLNEIAGEPHRVFAISDFSTLNRRLKNAIASQICEGSQISGSGGDGNSEPDIRYLGCFQDTNPRLFSKQLSNSFNQKAENCAQRCNSEGFQVSGIQLGYECHCGTRDQLLRAQKLDEARCVYPCPGNPSGEYKCGALYVMSAYEYVGTNAAGPDTNNKNIEHLGCFQEIVARKLPKLVVGIPVLTPETCLDACLSEGLDHAGLQAGSQCWCGDRGGFVEMDKLTEDKCGYKCIGDNSFDCGGALTASVYVTGNYGGGSHGIQPPPGTGTMGRCKDRQLDLLVAVDGGSSVGRRNFDQVKQFLKEIVNLFVIEPDRTMVGFVQFTDRPYSEFPFNQYRSRQEVLDAIDRVQWRTGGRRIGRALDHINRYELTTRRGHRRQAQTAVLLLTDGRSNDPVANPLRELQNRGVTIFVIGVTGKVDSGYLRALAGNGQRTAKVNRYDELDGHLRNEVAQWICDRSSGLKTGEQNKKELVYVGCYKETGSRQLSQYVVGSLQQTPETCLDACTDASMDTAGIFVGVQCWCGNRTSLQEANRETSDKCDFYKCVGNSSASCGGIGFLMSVYQYRMVQTPTFPRTWGSWIIEPRTGAQQTHWEPWNDVQGNGQTRRRRCSMDVVLMTDWSISTGRFSEIMLNIAQAVRQLSTNHDVTYAVATVDRDRDLKVFHGFNEDQSYESVKRALSTSQYLRGKEIWQSISARLLNSDRRHKKLIYIVGRDKPGTRITAEARTLTSRGVKVVPVLYDQTGISYRMEELQTLVGINRNRLLHNPSLTEIVDAVRC